MLRLAFGVALGASIDLLAIRFGWSDRLRRVALAFFPCYYLAITVHELGHLAAALAGGFRWRDLAAGPLIVLREAGGIRWRFVPSRILAGGQVQAVPETALDLRRRFLVLLAGGPLATAFVFAAAPAFRATHGRRPSASPTRSPPPRPSARRMAGGPLLRQRARRRHQLAALLHRRVRHRREGILLLRRGGAEADLLTTILYVMALDTQGVRPREWPPSATGGFQSAGDSPLSAAASILEIARSLDRGDPRRSKRLPNGRFREPLAASLYIAG